jgi:UDP-galactopyranose mutase
VDVAHFSRARTPQPDPADQANIPHPRLGFYGVVDERMDLDLVEAVAREREQWHQVIVGPCVKIDEASLPRRPNIHYLGMKRYDELPAYLSGWDVALLPFARNESTRFISPTKTPEYLAAGRQVVSTSITDVVRPYGQLGFVGIADQPAAFIQAIEHALTVDAGDWLPRVDRFLADLSWDRTWASMRGLIEETTAHPGEHSRARLRAEGAALSAEA